MAKYSTGNSSSSGGDACELCGTTTSDLRTANVAGAELRVCSNCASHGETKRTEKKRKGGGGVGGGGGLSERERKRRAARNAARMSDRAKASTKHWEEEGTHYDGDPLPYLVKGYGGKVADAREAAELTTSELADELDISEKDLVAVEEGRATSAGVGGSTIEALEERFDLRLAE